MSIRREIYVVECRPARVKPHVWVPYDAMMLLGDAQCCIEEAEYAARDGEESGPKDTIFRIVRYFPKDVP